MVRINSNFLHRWADFTWCQHSKLTPAPVNPIKGHHPHPPLLPEIIDGEEEWVIEEVLDSKMMNQKLHYLVKWEGFGVEHNSWEPQNNIHAPELVTDFHWRHPATPHCIRAIVFDSIPFHPSPPSIMLGRHSLEGGVDVRGHPILTCILNSSDSCSNHHSDALFNTLPYIPPHHRSLQWPSNYSNP